MGQDRGSANYPCMHYLEAATISLHPRPNPALLFFLHHYFFSVVNLSNPISPTHPSPNNSTTTWIFFPILILHHRQVRCRTLSRDFFYFNLKMYFIWLIYTKLHNYIVGTNTNFYLIHQLNNIVGLSNPNKYNKNIKFKLNALV